MEDDITVRFTRSEALVLFEWLARVDSAGAIPVEDESERTVLWKLEGMLESVLTEPLRSEYSELLAAARKRVRDGYD